MEKRAHKVLVVDDSALMHSLYESMFAHLQILHAHDGVEALEVLAGAKDVDLVLLDIEMPRMNGMTVLDRMRRDGKTHHIPVVFVTSCVGVDDMQRGLAAGANAYVTKPFDAGVLLATVEGLLTHAHSPVLAPEEPR